MADSFSPSSLINCVAYGADGQRLPPIDIEQISDVLDTGEGFVWVGLHEPDAALLERMREEFGLHELAIEDAAHAHQRPKLEVYGDSFFIAMHTVQRINGRIAFGETHIFVGRNYMLTVRHDASLSYAPARARCERTPALLAKGPSYALYAVLDFIVDNMLPIADEFEDELEALEKDIFNDEFRRSTIERLYKLKGELVRLRLAVAPLQDILNQLVRFHGDLIQDDVRPYFRDVFDHAMRANEAIDTVREMLSAAMSVNLALVNIHQGEVVKRLAGWAALVAVPTLVASWYGMNFTHMPELAGPVSYYVTAGVTLAVGAALFVMLKRARWL